MSALLPGGFSVVLRGNSSHLATGEGDRKASLPRDIDELFSTRVVQQSGNLPPAARGSGVSAWQQRGVLQLTERGEGPAVSPFTVTPLPNHNVQQQQAWKEVYNELLSRGVFADSDRGDPDALRLQKWIFHWRGAESRFPGSREACFRQSNVWAPPFHHVLGRPHLPLFAFPPFLSVGPIPPFPDHLQSLMFERSDQEGLDRTFFCRNPVWRVLLEFTFNHELPAKERGYQGSFTCLIETEREIWKSLQCVTESVSKLLNTPHLESSYYPPGGLMIAARTLVAMCNAIGRSTIGNSERQGGIDPAKINETLSVARVVSSVLDDIQKTIDGYLAAKGCLFQLLRQKATAASDDFNGNAQNDPQHDTEELQQSVEALILAYNTLGNFWGSGRYDQILDALPQDHRDKLQTFINNRLPLEEEWANQTKTAGRVQVSFAPSVTGSTPPSTAPIPEEQRARFIPTHHHNLHHHHHHQPSPSIPTIPHPQHHYQHHHPR